MNASVPPTSFVTSISGLRFLISSRIVLPTTIATAIASKHGREVDDASERARASLAGAPPIACRAGRGRSRAACGSRPRRASTSPAAPLAGRTTSVSGSGLPSSASSASPKPGLRAKLLERGRAIDELHARDVGARRDLARQRARSLGRHVALEVDGEVGRALPAAAQRAARCSRARGARPAARSRSRSRAP